MRRDLHRRLDAIQETMAPAWETELDRRDLPAIEAEMAKPTPPPEWWEKMGGTPVQWEECRRNDLVEEFRLRRKETPKQTAARHEEAQEKNRKDMAKMMDLLNAHRQT